MKLHKGDFLEIERKIAFNWSEYLEIKLNGYVQHESDHEYILKRCGLTKEWCLKRDRVITHKIGVK